MARSRRFIVPSLVAVLVAAYSVWAEMPGFAWNDYDNEASGPMSALVHGHFGAFLSGAPGYGGSLLLRSPFAFLAHWFGGGELSVYRMLAVPCLLAAIVLGIVLWDRRVRTVDGARWSIIVVVLAAGNPVTLRALEIGHPEELFGGALCVGAVLAALGKRPWLTALLLGLAVANKPWAVLAVGPVLLALPERRMIVMTLAGAIAAALLAPFLLHHGDAASPGAMGTTVGIFQPQQLWWPLGDLDHVVRGLDGLVKVGYRTPPPWLGHITHPLIAFLVVPATLAWRWRRGRDAGPDVLLLLAFLLLARCILDPWNIGYYHVPFLLALLGWEALARARPPVLSLAAAGMVWLTFEKLPDSLSPDALCAFYLAWALPVLLVIGAVAFRVPLPRALRRRSQPVALVPSS